MILLLRSSGILASIQCANNRMSYRQLTIITMEQEYSEQAKKIPTEMNICATYKRSGDQRESIIPQNDRHNKKQRELFAASAAVVLN